MDGSRLSLVLPAFNEEAGLRQAIVEADQALAGLFADYEILVVDDGSRDRTASVAADEAGRRPHVRLLRHEHNRGYGAALRTGFEAARFELVAFTDADCQFHLDDLALLAPLAETNDVVAGYRIDRKDRWRRRFASGGYNLLVRTLMGTPVRDIDCALKVFRRESLAHLLPETRGFFVNTEMLTRAVQHGMSIAEVGVRHRPRVRGQSTVSLREIPRVLGQLLPFWWSRVLFAGGPPCPSLTPNETVAEAGGSPSRWREVLPLLCLLLVASLLFFSRLRAPLLEPQEGRYAEIPRQMLAEGRWVVPVLHGQPYLDKPPLLYWAVMASYKVFGVHDTSARLVPGFACLFTVLVSFFWGRRVLGPAAGLCGALVLCATPEFVYRGRMLTFDTLLALWVVSALAAGHAALLGGRLRPLWWLLSALACGLGVLTKGPVALVLAAAPLFVLSLLDPRLARPGWRGWLVYLAACLAVGAPWYALVLAAEPGFAAHFFWRHNLVRFFAPFDHARPFWYYLPGLAAGLLPWALVVPGLFLRLRERSGEAASGRPGGLGLLLLAPVWTVVFFSLAGSKRPTYLLPALPPLALALGWYVRTGAADLWRRASPSAVVAAWTVVLAGTGMAALAGHRHVIRESVCLPLLAAGLAACVGLLVAGRRVNWAATTGVALAALLLGVQHLLPGYNTFFSLRGQLRRMARAGEGNRPVVCYPQRFESLSFYLPHRPVKVFGPDQRRQLIRYLEDRPDTLVLVKGGAPLEQLRRELPPWVEFRTRQRRGAVIVGRAVARNAAPERWLAGD